MFSFRYYHLLWSASKYLIFVWKSLRWHSTSTIVLIRKVLKLSADLLGKLFVTCKGGYLIKAIPSPEFCFFFLCVGQACSAHVRCYK